MRDEIDFNGTTYVSVRTAAEDTGLTRDYIARLCKRGMLDAHRIGAMWYLDPRSLSAFQGAQEHARQYRREALARDRAKEYQEKKAQQLAKPEIEQEQTITERMRELIEDTSAAGTAALSESSNVPGFVHAAVNIPTQAISHVPVHAVAPTVELLHRIAALVSAFVLVLGVYTVFDHTYAQVAYSSAANFYSNSVDAAQQFGTSASWQGSRMAAAVDAAAANPRAALDSIMRSLSEVTHSVHTIAPAQANVKADVTQVAAAANAIPAPSAEVSGAPTTPVAISVAFTGGSVSYGDLVSYDKAKDAYTLTVGSNDAGIFGVVVRDPALLFKPDGLQGNIPVMRSGPALVNVTLENGSIAIGDPLTSSSIAGKARKANDGEHILGYAQEAFDGQGGVSLKTSVGTNVLSGTIPVNVTAGAGADTANGSQSAGCASIPCRIAAALDPKVVAALIRYIFSAIIATITLTLAFKSFMSDANYGVISMGRNPRAKSSIQSLVFFNAILAVAIASTGLFAAMMILFAG